MKRIVNGEVYDTMTANLLAMIISSAVSYSPSKIIKTYESLYVNDDGEFFLNIKDVRGKKYVVPMSMAEVSKWELEHFGEDTIAINSHRKEKMHA